MEQGRPLEMDDVLLKHLIPKYNALRARCEKMEQVIEKIAHSPVPANEREYISWFVTCKNMANGMLSELEAEKFVVLEQEGEKGSA